MTFNDRNQDKSRADAPLKHHWGARFKAAREAMHLTEKDAAARLHLKPHLIGIIETERFENGPPPIFMRGYIRSYARLLNMPEKEVTQALSQLNLENPATSTPTPMVRKRISNHNNSNTGWSTSLVVLVLVGLVGMWWNTHSRNSSKESALAPANQIVAPVANNTAQTIDNSNLPQTPADPTPKELLNSQTAALIAPNNPAAPVTAVPAAPVVASTTTTPIAPTAATPTVNTSTEDSAKSNPAAAESEQPATQTASDDNATPESTDGQSALPATAETEADAKPAKSKTRIAKAKTSDMASDEMVIPEQGLEPEDNNN
jgi:cytoskeleton protein RodZ